jgi:hypothetical protein
VPAGGLVWFWPAAGLALLAIGAAGVSLARRGRRFAAGPLAVAAAVLMFTVGLATWYSPYGWVAWGPRLALPVVPAALVAGAWAGRARLVRWTAALLRPPAAAVVVAVGLAVAAWPHLGVPWTQRAAIETMIRAGEGCPAVTGLHVQSRPGEYHRCIRRAMWRLQPNTLVAASTGGGWPAAAARSSGVVAAVALVLLARRAALRSRAVA